MDDLTELEKEVLTNDYLPEILQDDRVNTSKIFKYPKGTYRRLLVSIHQQKFSSSK